MKQIIFFSIPFVTFGATIIFLATITKKEAFPAPNLLGISVTDGLKIASENNMYIRILEQREDPVSHPETILEQNPKPGQLIKEKQTIFLVVSKTITPIKTPNLLQQSLSEIRKKNQSKLFSTKIYYIASNEPRDTILAQYPEPDQDLHDQNIILYVSTGKQTEQVIMPNLVGITESELKKIQQKTDLSFEIHRLNEHKDQVEPAVLRQLPLAGTILDTKKLNSCQIELGTVNDQNYAFAAHR